MSHWNIVSSSTACGFFPVHAVTDGAGYGAGVDFILVLDEGWCLDDGRSLDTLGGSP